MMPAAEVKAVSGDRQGAHLGIIPVILNGPKGKSLHTCALLDNGSTTSFIDEGIAESLGLTGSKIEYRVSTLTERSKSYSGRSVSIKLVTDACPGGVFLENVWTSPVLNLPCHSAASMKDVMKHPHLRDISLKEVHGKDVRLLIGVGSGLLTPLEVRVPPNNKLPYAERTILGWVVRGPSGAPAAREAEANFTHMMGEDTLQSSLERMWQRDFSELGAVKSGAEACMSVEDQRALRKMEQSIVMKEGHYEIALPWKEDVVLPNNRTQAVLRLQQVKRRLRHNGELHRMYVDAMDAYIADGYARAVEESDDSPLGNTWYLPHHAVSDARKPSQVRIVFDGAAKYNGASINESLYQRTGSCE
jgi:hypothetical protein